MILVIKRTSNGWIVSNGSGEQEIFVTWPGVVYYIEKEFGLGSGDRLTVEDSSGTSQSPEA